MRRGVDQNHPDYYRSSGGYLYSNRMAKMLEVGRVTGDVIARLEKYFDALYIDEVQDFASHDFDLLYSFARADVNVLYVGDFFQHTYATSRDGNRRQGLYDEYESFKGKFREMGLIVDTETLEKSWRCSPTTCQFICDKLGIEIASHREDTTLIETVTSQEVADGLITDDTKTKLFYSSHYKFGCCSQNWGKSKGEDHHCDICIVMSPNVMRKMESGDLAPMTKKKLYVALSRARGNVYFLPSRFCNKYKIG